MAIVISNQKNSIELSLDSDIRSNPFIARMITDVVTGGGGERYNVPLTDVYDLTIESCVFKCILGYGEMTLNIFEYDEDTRNAIEFFQRPMNTVNIMENRLTNNYDLSVSCISGTVIIPKNVGTFILGASRGIYAIGGHARKMHVNRTSISELNVHPDTSHIYANGCARLKVFKGTPSCAELGSTGLRGTFVVHDKMESLSLNGSILITGIYGVPSHSLDISGTCISGKIDIGTTLRDFRAMSCHGLRKIKGHARRMDMTRSGLKNCVIIHAETTTYIAEHCHLITGFIFLNNNDIDHHNNIINLSYTGIRGTICVPHVSSFSANNCRWLTGYDGGARSMTFRHSGIEGIVDIPIDTTVRFDCAGSVGVTSFSGYTNSMCFAGTALSGDITFPPDATVEFFDHSSCPIDKILGPRPRRCI